MDEAFERVRAEPDALEQARAATELMAVYQQRSAELARLRRDAVERAASERGMSFTAVAQALGLSKGRITQIRQSAPPVERAFFGIGPVTLAVPARHVPDAGAPAVAATDTEAGRVLTGLLEGLAFSVRPARVPPGAWALPDGDLVVLCGPISSLTMATAYEADPLLKWARGSGRVWQVDRATGRRWGSPMDDDEPATEDLAYVGRLPRPGGHGTLVAVAGIHAVGTLGAVVWLRDHLADLHEATRGHPFSMIVGSTHDGLRITGTAVRCPPRVF